MDLVTLGLRLDAGQLVAGAGRAKTAMRGLTEETKKTTTSMTAAKRAAAALAAALAAWRAAKWARDTLLLGARYETLGVVMDGGVGNAVSPPRRCLNLWQYWTGRARPRNNSAQSL